MLKKERNVFHSLSPESPPPHPIGGLADGQEIRLLGGDREGENGPFATWISKETKMGHVFSVKRRK